ncbi:MAG: hypothetical protein LBN39_12455 [Planctomycetaceae bacterium]|nr:hypothetical protein [Planctomycetaceae bacterium]
MMFTQIAWFYVIVCAVLGVAVGRHGLKPKGEKLYAIIGIVLSVLNILFPVLLIILAILDV